MAIVSFLAPAVTAQGPGTSLYFVTSNLPALVGRVHLDGSNFETLIDNLEGVLNFRAMAVDPIGGKMYFSTVAENKLLRANLDGTDIETLFAVDDHGGWATSETGGLGVGSQDIELDLSTGKVYFQTTSGISRSNLDGSEGELIIVENTPLVSRVTALAIDPPSNTIFFTDGGDGDRILRSDLDGGNIEVLIQFAVGVVTIDLEDIEVDADGGKIYWTDGPTGKLQRSNLDGTNIEDLLVGVPGFTAFGRRLALDTSANKVYWSTPGSPFGPGNPGGIFRANLDGSEPEIVWPHEGDVHGLDFGPRFVCGDSILSPGEQCDDGNTQDGDGCSADCLIESTGVPAVPNWGLILFSVLVLGSSLLMMRRGLRLRA